MEGSLGGETTVTDEIRLKAEWLVGLVVGNCSLDGCFVSEEWKKDAIEQTIKELRGETKMSGFIEASENAQERLNKTEVFALEVVRAYRYHMEHPEKSLLPLWQAIERLDTHLTFHG